VGSSSGGSVAWCHLHQAACSSNSK
jgi:hypothetical protein